ncbi:SUF system NifU family Fe-S cluster assembly protein [Candidatus Uhrbacteria bacterium]|nr:SUF system NifU family Fe-S cluster assembly protein [Candidatus Uhrbacteria bacterium]
MDLYSEIILDHYRHPRHRGSLPRPSAHIVQHNPLCGDIVKLDISVKEGKVADARFLGAGCAISQAATSLLLDSIQGKSIGSIEKLTQQDAADLLGIPVSKAREQCAQLGLTALQKAITIFKQKRKQKR